MFKGQVPAGQPRTLRSIAQTVNRPANFMDPPLATDDVAPQGQPTQGPGTAGMPAVRPLTPADPRPFTNLRGK